MRRAIGIAVCCLIVGLLFHSETSAATCNPTSTTDDQYLQRHLTEFGSHWVPAHCNNFTVSNSRTIDLIVIHTTDADTAQSTKTWFQKGNQVIPGSCGLQEKNEDYCRTSAHYLVDVDGIIFQFVREKDIAHHAGAENTRSIGMEHVGDHDDPNWPGPTEAMYQSSASLVRHLARRYNLNLTRDNFRQIVKGHDELVAKIDPGPKWDWDHFIDLVFPGTSTAYVTNEFSNNVSAVAISGRGGSEAVIGDPIEVGTRPIGIVATPDGKKVYVGNSDSNSVSVIDTASNTVIKTIPGIIRPMGEMVVSPDGSRVYVGSDSNHIFEIDTSTDTLTVPPSFRCHERHRSDRGRDACLCDRFDPRGRDPRY